MFINQLLLKFLNNISYLDRFMLEHIMACVTVVQPEQSQLRFVGQQPKFYYFYFIINMLCIYA